MPTERPLAYKDKWVWQLTEIVSESINPDALATFPDQTTQVELTISLNQLEYTRILSALCVGAELAFPTKAQQIYYDFMKMTNGSLPVSCEDIADCIEQQLSIDPETNEPVDPDFYNTITEVVNGSGFGNPNRINATQTKIADRQEASFESDEIAELASCDLNALWAGIRHGIVDRLDENLQDALQDIAAIPTIIGRNAAWLDIIPVLGDLAEATVTSISSVVPTLLSLYEAYSSEATKDELACELFGLVCAECRYPTHAEVYDHFKNYGMEATPSITEWTLQVMTDLLTNPVGVAAKVAYFTLMTWQLGIIYVNATFNQAKGTAALGKLAALGEDSANNNWIDLCETCDEQWQIKYYDFTQSPSGWQLQPQIGSQVVGGKWTAGQGWSGTESPSGSGQYVTRIVINIKPEWRIRGIGFNYVGTGIDLAQTGASFRPTAGTNTGVVNQSFSTGTNYNRSNCLLAVNQGYSQVTIIMIGNNASLLINKAFLTFDAGYGTGERAASRAIC